MRLAKDHHIISKHQVIQLHLLTGGMVTELWVVGYNLHEPCEVIHGKDKQKWGEWVTLLEASSTFKCLTLLATNIHFI